MELDSRNDSKADERAKTTNCAALNGGSDCVGANAFRAATFSKACTTATKTLR